MCGGGEVESVSSLGAMSRGSVCQCVRLGMDGIRHVNLR